MLNCKYLEEVFCHIFVDHAAICPIFFKVQPMGVWQSGSGVVLVLRFLIILVAPQWNLICLTLN